MRKKKKTWLEIKATKEPKEWRRINRIYSQRRRLRNQLRIKAADDSQRIVQKHCL